MKTSYVVTVDKPDNMTDLAVRHYISEAVSMWAGQMRPPGANGADDPGDPRWALYQKPVTVKTVKESK